MDGCFDLISLIEVIIGQNLVLCVAARGTETLALKQPDGSYKLYGYKWFSSSTDSDMSLTLARPCTEDGKYKEVILTLVLNPPQQLQHLPQSNARWTSKKGSI